MAKLFALCLVLAACGGELVPTERMPIHWVGGNHGRYEKGGIGLDGWTCGEQYRRAVAGNADAEELVASCACYSAAYGVLLSGFALAIPTAIVIGEETDSKLVVGVTVAVGVTSFLVGTAMGYLGNRHLREAIHIYNAGAEAPAPY